ncbi:ABC transporter substrate-binding protein [Azospirillum sp. TSO22-1]|uniref:ABC transporter substrate-binding protein n=1 Tax=Azospirillum sp. TSO22-1 TaxID=716789 RepID=UPI000D61DF26|nr:ABC transporter substrate-binding protein [Azospirillum sp. TSO22-1]PWC35177.1 branched-chain amino acid ABC transporter substrate-binding protein [Azospirillum sp. TSO22-1]
MTEIRSTACRGLRRVLLAAGVAAALPGAALADVTVGLIVPATGSTAALGIPAKNTAALFPETIAGEKLRVIVVDDASDPTTATTQARRLVTEEKVDVLLGSVMTGAAIAVAGVARESEVPQLSLSPIDLPAGADKWTFRMPQNVTLMAKAVIAHMRANNVKTVGFIGFSDAWGDFWLRDLKALADASGFKLVAEERYARADTSVTGQALKLLAARPDAILVGASGTAAALPQITLRERGYKGPIYQTHGAVTHDFIRIGGAAVEGAILASGPVMVADQLPEGHPVRAVASDYVTKYEAKYGANTRTQFGAHTNDAIEVLKRVVPVALKTAKPGSKEFRAALRDALENEKEIPASQGVYNFTKDDHFGLDQRGYVLLTIEKGGWKLLK